jgi:hypothetical protein
MVTRSPDEAPARLTADGTRAIEDLQFEGWRQWSSVETAQMLNAAWRAGNQLAWFGLKDRFPGAPERELRLRLTIETLGPDLACRIHPEARALLDD